MSATHLSTWQGIRTMAGLELKLRLRAGRWRWLLGAWFVLLFIFLFVLRMAVHSSTSGVYIGDNFQGSPVKRPLGTPMYGGLMLFMLGVAMLVVPALTAQSVNGDRERGVLASLQTTLLTPVQIAGGKLMAAWGTALVFVAVSIPLVIWTVVEGGVGAGRAVVGLVVISLILGVIVAVAQCLSAVLVRSTTSAVMSYLFVFALSLLTVISFALALQTTGVKRTHTEQYPVFSDPQSPDKVTQLQEQTYTYTQTDSSKVWWLLAPNPFVILADSAPQVAPRCDPRTGMRLYDSLDPLGGLGTEMRKLRIPLKDRDNSQIATPHCPNEYSGFSSVNQTGDAVGPNGGVTANPASAAPKIVHPAPVWPWGLGFDVLVAAGAFSITVRRLKAPAHKLAQGVRVA